MADLAAKRAAIEAKLAKIGERATITFTSKALNKSAANTSVDVWVYVKGREVARKGEAATITALVTTSERAIENGVLTIGAKSYQIVSLKQIGVGTGHLMSEVVASEL